MNPGLQRCRIAALLAEAIALVLISLITSKRAISEVGTSEF